MRIGSLALLLLTCAGTLMASAVAPPPSTYTYTISIPSVAGGAEVDSNFSIFQFSWKGPLRFNSPPNSFIGYSEVGAPKPGYFDAGPTLTSAGSNPEVIVRYSDFSGGSFATSNTVTFKFIEPDSFWSTPGSQTFAADNATPVESGIGASFAIGGTDPGCTGCTVNTTITAAAPEPVTLILIAPALAALLMFRQRRKRLLAG